MLRIRYDDNSLRYDGDAEKRKQKRIKEVTHPA